MNFARTAFLLVVLSLPAIAAETAATVAPQHADAGDAAAVTTPARPEFTPADVKRYNAAVNACMVGRQEFGAPSAGIAPLTTTR